MRTLIFILVLVCLAALIIGWIVNRPPKAAQLKSEEKNELLSLRQMKDNIQIGVGESYGSNENAVAVVLDEIRAHSARMRELNS